MRIREFLKRVKLESRGVRCFTTATPCEDEPLIFAAGGELISADQRTEVGVRQRFI